MRLAAACADAAVEAVFVDLRAHGRNFEDLMALRLAGQLELWPPQSQTASGLQSTRRSTSLSSSMAWLWPYCPGAACRACDHWRGVALDSACRARSKTVAWKSWNPD